MYKPGNEKATRIEVRFPDPAANPYLAFSVLLAAGMAGVNGKYELRAPFEEDVFHLSSEQRKKHQIEELPGSLDEAVKLAEQSALVRSCLGEHIFGKFRRLIPLPAGLSVDRLQAQMRSGVLEIRVPRVGGTQDVKSVPVG